MTTSGNTTAAFNFSGFGSRAFVKDWSYAEATPYRNQGVNNNGFIFSINDDLAGSHKVYTEYGTVVSSTATRHTASGISWEIKLTNATYINANMPFRQAIQAVPVKSGVAMTASVWMYRSNTGVT